MKKHFIIIAITALPMVAGKPSPSKRCQHLVEHITILRLINAARVIERQERTKATVQQRRVGSPRITHISFEEFYKNLSLFQEKNPHSIQLSHKG